MMPYLPIILSLVSGFLSLSQEILWVRLVGFALHGSPRSFALVLGMYLIGIAFGALLGRRLCLRAGGNLVSAAGCLMLLAMLFDSVAPFLCVHYMHHLSFTGIIMLSVACSGGIRSAVFPIVHHLGSQNQRRLGTSISNVYFANVIGASLGPLVTGFFLMDWLGLQKAILVVSLLTGLTGIVCLTLSEGQRSREVRDLGAVLVMVVFGILWLPELLVSGMAGYHWWATTANPSIAQPVHVIENRYGIIHTRPDVVNSDEIVFGGNAYDGRVNTDLHHNTNGIARAYLISALKPDARHVLVIGLSSGAWVRVLSAMPGIESIDVVEINPGYLQLIAAYPAVAPILHDPRIHIHIDDGRRWLARHPDSHFDLVLMNTTYHWRNYISNLVSQDFLRSLKTHMDAGGLLYYNCTSSNDVFYTASTVFTHAYRYSNFVAASDADFLKGFDKIHVLNAFVQLRWPDSGKPVFDMYRTEDIQLVNMVLPPNAFMTVADYQRQSVDPFELVTDQNMLTEFKKGMWLEP